jgi:hydrogenase maturation protein HypF
MATRVRARVQGTVQGVGFRPYVYRLARAERLGGWVRNDERGVVLEVEGAVDAVERFLARLPREAPPLAAVERVRRRALACVGESEFAIVESRGRGPAAAPVAPDTPPCAACLDELQDPADRRFRYPFVNCTDCGPRFTIVSGVPYDRTRTTMASFEMCAACRAEYDDPLDRRFHAEPNACPACGPRARLVDAGGRDAGTEARDARAAAADASLVDAELAPRDAVAAAAAALLDGAIVAVKGVGGYHLACRADDEAAVAALRARKHREDKPFALMAADLDAAGALVELTAAEERLMTGRERPIVIATRRPAAAVAAAVAPGRPDLGVMLPSTPLHHLLLADAGVPLVMTSGNVSDEPIAFDDADALERLSGVADRFLVHDRPIETRADDSVVRGPLLLRRSRGLVPAAIELPAAQRPLLSCGAELKSTFCLAKGGRAWVGHHIGDLKNWETLRSYHAGIAHFERLFAIAPELVAHDLHPDYLSTAYALERDGVERLAVQHHHAHLAACLAEHGEAGPAVGAIYDGAGLGSDETVWGGELLVGAVAGCERAGHIWPVRLPGGDAAVREPWRMACAWLHALGDADPAMPPALADAVTRERWEAVAALVRSGTAAPVTTSAGRLFDAVAALCGIRSVVNYEGQAAAELEATCDPHERGAYPMPVAAAAAPAARAAPVASGATDATPPFVLDARATIAAVVDDLGRGVAPAVVAARFHGALAHATAHACELVASRHGLDAVVLSGGAFQNRVLLEGTSELLAGRGLRVLFPRRLPPNDGGIAFGQAAIAASAARS